MGPCRSDYLLLSGTLWQRDLSPICPTGRLLRPFGQLVDRVPDPGDISPGFFVQSGRSFRMIRPRRLHSTHRPEPPAWKAFWKDSKGKRWHVSACREHAPWVNSPQDSALRAIYGWPVAAA